MDELDDAASVEWEARHAVEAPEPAAETESEPAPVATRTGFLAWCAELLSDMIRFTRAYAAPLLVSAALILVNFGRLLFSDNVGIDTEMMINIPGTILNWYSIGREGMAFSKMVLDTLAFNMYVQEALGLAFLLLCVWLWCYLMYRLGAHRQATFVIFPLVFATHPIFVEQFYFTTQVAEFNFAMCMIPLGLLLIVESARSEGVAARVLGCLIAAALFLWAFASYQSFLALAIAGGALVGLMLSVRRDDGLALAERKRRFWRTAASFAVAFVVGAVLYLVITRLWFSSSDYLTKQVLWGTMPAFDCLKRVGEVVFDMAVGEGLFYTPAFTVAAVLLVVRIALDYLDARRTGFSAVSVLLAVLMLASPFMLPAVMAAMPAARTAFTLPFVTAACAALFWEGTRTAWPAVAFKRFAAVAVCVVLAASQMGTSLRLLYTDDVAYQQSVEFATTLCHEIDPLIKGNSGKAVVFIGCWDPPLNAACLKGEYIGVSEFHWGDASLPHYHRSSEIVLNWLEAIGHKYAHPTEEQVIEARKIAQTMTFYPQTGEVYDAGDYVIVKLGPDLFYTQDIATPVAIHGPEGTPSAEDE